MYPGFKATTRALSVHGLSTLWWYFSSAHALYYNGLLSPSLPRMECLSLSLARNVGLCLSPFHGMLAIVSLPCMECWPLSPSLPRMECWPLSPPFIAQNVGLCPPPFLAQNVGLCPSPFLAWNAGPFVPLPPPYLPLPRMECWPLSLSLPRMERWPLSPSLPRMECWPLSPSPPPPPYLPLPRMECWPLSLSLAWNVGLCLSPPPSLAQTYRFAVTESFLFFTQSEESHPIVWKPEILRRKRY